MLKGTPQSLRNNAWHAKHTKKLALFKANRVQRVYNYIHGMEKINTTNDLLAKRVRQLRDSDRLFVNRVKDFFKSTASKITSFFGKKQYA